MVWQSRIRFWRGKDNSESRTWLIVGSVRYHVSAAAWQVRGLDSVFQCSGVFRCFHQTSVAKKAELDILSVRTYSYWNTGTPQIISNLNWNTYWNTASRLEH